MERTFVTTHEWGRRQHVRPEPSFVDCHSHVLPSGDDGATTVEEGRTLCREAARRGTRILFATPHVWPHLTLTEERAEAIEEAFAALRPQAGLELRLGYELTPTEALLDDDPARYALDGTGAVLMEAPFAGPLETLVALAEHTERAGFTPVIAHPERAEAIVEEPHRALELAARGWLLQVNSTSLLGYHGEPEETLGWRLVEGGHTALVASDGHRAARPPQLDAAFAAVRARVPDEQARALFDGSALGVATARRPRDRAA
jgi:protein-tyrosine phosphatase